MATRMDNSMKRQSLYFRAPYCVDVDEEVISEPGPGEVLVKTLVSAISSGTERLIYQGLVPSDMPIDDTIDAFKDNKFSYPLKYGYAAVGQVIAVGQGLDDSWNGAVVFAFNPHESHFITTPDSLIPLSISPEDAVFLPNMETAVSFVMDAEPLIGEHIAVFGQGITGLLTTRLLSEHPLTSLITLDPIPSRRAHSRQFGATESLDPRTPDHGAQVLALLQKDHCCSGADLTFELSGHPDALQNTIDITRCNGRILLGSWYGDKKVGLNLGGSFHRSQIQIISSQVSHLAPRWRGRWDKTRRMQVALSFVKRYRPASLITHRFPLNRADEAYRLLDQARDDTLQIIFTY